MDNNYAAGPPSYQSAAGHSPYNSQQQQQQQQSMPQQQSTPPQQQQSPQPPYHPVSSQAQLNAALRSQHQPVAAQAAQAQQAQTVAAQQAPLLSTVVGTGGALHTFSAGEVRAYVEFIKNNERVQTRARELGIALPPLDGAAPPQQFFDAVRSGVLFALLLDAVKPDAIDMRRIAKTPRSQFESHGNHYQLIDALKRLGADTVNIGPGDLQEGRPHIVLGVAWTIVRLHLLHNKLSVRRHPELVALLHPDEDVHAFVRMPREHALLRWFNYHLQAAEHPRRVQNFAGDVRDCECYAALLNQLRPGSIDRDAFAAAPQQRKAELVHAAACALAPEAGRFAAPADLLDGNPKLNFAFTACLFEACPGLRALDDAATRARREALERAADEQPLLAATAAAPRAHVAHARAHAHTHTHATAPAAENAGKAADDAARAADADAARQAAERAQQEAREREQRERAEFEAEQRRREQFEAAQRAAAADAQRKQQAEREEAERRDAWEREQQAEAARRRAEQEQQQRAFAAAAAAEEQQRAAAWAAQQQQQQQQSHYPMQSYGAPSAADPYAAAAAYQQQQYAPPPQSYAVDPYASQYAGYPSQYPPPSTPNYYGGGAPTAYGGPTQIHNVHYVVNMGKKKK